MRKYQMLAMGFAGLIAWTLAADTGRIGVFKDARSHITDGILLTLTEAGYETQIIDRNDLQQAEKLLKIDVLFLPGGWNAIKFAGFNGRRNMIDFVAQGKGVLAAAFRGGYVRTGNRPIFPQIGIIHNRVNGTGIFPSGDSPLLEGINEPFYISAWDHMVVKTGPRGKIFLTDSSGLPVGVSGEIYGGRYILLGAFIGTDAKKHAMLGHEKTLFLNCIAWLLAASELPADDIKAYRQGAELDFLRMEKILDYTLDERGPDYGPGVIPEIKYQLASALHSRKFRLEECAQYVAGADRQRVDGMLAQLGLALEELERRYQELTAEKINEVNASTLDKLVADNPFYRMDDVLRMIAAMPGKTADEKKEVESAIAGMDKSSQYDNAPKLAAKYLYGDVIRARLFDEDKRKTLVDKADGILLELNPQIQKAKAAKCGLEKSADKAAVPGLIKQSSSDNAAIRRNAALELGRIGDQRAEAVLVKLLEDSDANTRVNATLALGWMQSKSAVPRLIEALQGSDKWMRRRAAQALGQIGDQSAVEALLPCISDDDAHVRENTILALGWLKAGEAVPALVNIITDFDRQDYRQRKLMLAAMRALGHIGDKRALPQLEHWAQNADDFPAPRKPDKGQRIANIYSTAQSLGLQGHAEMAMEEIKAGGRSETGVRQADFLSRYDKYYGLTRQFNFFVGRPFLLIRSNFPDEPEIMFDYIRDAGGTGVHNAWGQQDYDPVKFIGLMQAAGERDLKWIDVMPIGGNRFGSKEAYHQPQQDKTLDKSGAELVLFKFADIPAFHGFWTEEDYPLVEMENDEFVQYLRKKYGDNYRKILGVDDAVGELLPPREKRGGWRFDRGKNELAQDAHFANMRVFAEFLECAGELLLEHWREDQEWLHGVRKGCAFTFSETTGQRFSYPGVAGKAGGVVDAHGPESYQSFGSDNAFMMELNKDGEARPVMCEYYNMYSPSPEHAARGFAQHLMHGECFYNFSLCQIFQQASYYYMWSWDKSYWDKAGMIFRKAAKLRKYLTVPESAANVALVANERTALLFYSRQYGERVPVARRYYQNQSGLWSALQQSQIPSDAIWAETMTAEKLMRYRVLLLSDAKSMTPDEVGLIRAWVRDGGILIAGGTTSLFDQWGVQRDNYALADVFGMDYAGYAADAVPEQNDTYGFDQGRPPFRIEDGGYDPDRIRNYVLRDIKPVKSIGIYSVSDDHVLHGLGKGFACEYDMPLGYDRVQLSKARPLAHFANGAPALAVNKFGKGLCYFWMPIYPGLCYAASGWEMQENFKDFWPGSREILEAMVKGGLKSKTEYLPVEAVNCPDDIEITVRQQPGEKRLMIHLLNLDPDLSRVRSVTLNITSPSSGAVNISYPDAGRQIPFQRFGGRLVFTARAFDVHDMILVEY